MSKKSHKKPKKTGRTPDERPEPSNDGSSSMQADTDHPHEPADLRDEVAVIAPVTDAMMDHAAHEAATLADGVARGTVVLEKAAVETQVATERVAEQASDLSDRAIAAAGEAARPVVEAADAASRSAADAAGAAAQGAGETADRGTRAAREALSASADALTQYNAKVMEIMQSNLASTTALFAALIKAKSVPEALSLNADHLRRQMEALTSQGRELATLAQRVAFDALHPFKGAADR
ncbi:phasin family protein [Lichenibacterium dinghuense]|uniref:phasin family protein n=1 Tax=Lichenibacterium dinghuense TaxID=2895977 RepID=UPI001F30CEE2|nr:phasin family protein [Lichenibacterium sp. 6Y81]